MGRDGIDNGWIRFDHVRIPRDYMMMKHAQVSEDGVHTKPPRATVACGALLAGRSSMRLAEACHDHSRTSCALPRWASSERCVRLTLCGCLLACLRLLLASVACFGCLLRLLEYVPCAPSL